MGLLQQVDHGEVAWTPCGSLAPDDIRQRRDPQPHALDLDRLRPGNPMCASSSVTRALASNLNNWALGALTWAPEACSLHTDPPEVGRMTWLRLLLVLVATLSLAACEVVGDIFQAGMAVGVIMVVAVIALIAFIVAKIRS
jgi:hypothetical protein